MDQVVTIIAVPCGPVKPNGGVPGGQCNSTTREPRGRVIIEGTALNAALSRA